MFKFAASQFSASSSRQFNLYALQKIAYGIFKNIIYNLSCLYLISIKIVYMLYYALAVLYMSRQSNKVYTNNDDLKSFAKRRKLQ